MEDTSFQSFSVSKPQTKGPSGLLLGQTAARGLHLQGCRFRSSSRMSVGFLTTVGQVANLWNNGDVTVDLDMKLGSSQALGTYLWGFH